jgi:DNA-binding HxlR family transcriptional regulator
VRYGIRTAAHAVLAYAGRVKSYGQFCSVARALDLVGERWTLLVVRELLSGTTQFNDIRRGIPRISRTMLSERLRELVDAGVVARAVSEGGPAYALTESGLELASTVREVGVWGQRWLPRTLPRDELDGETLLWDVQRRVRLEKLPAKPIVLRIALTGTRAPASHRFLLLRRTEVSLCKQNPGFPVEIELTVSLRTMTAWWRGDLSFDDARAEGLVLRGRKEWVRAFPSWFARYAFADVRPVGTDSVPEARARRS